MLMLDNFYNEAPVVMREMIMMESIIVSPLQTWILQTLTAESYLYLANLKYY